MVRIDLIYEGIATHFYFCSKLNSFFMSELTWFTKGLRLSVFRPKLSITPSLVRIDLIYEGIATYENWCVDFIYFSHFVRIDLIYEGIATLPFHEKE